MHSRLAGGAAFALAAALTTWSCGGSSSAATPTNPTPTPTPTPAPTPNTVTVTIVGSNGSQAYNPNPVTMNNGDTVAFKNADSTTHHVVMDDGSADLGDIAPGATKTMTLSKATGNFHCTIHATMVGSINGKVPDPPPCNTPGYCP